MDATLLDYAYALYKQGSEAHCAGSLAELQNEYPQASKAEIVDAFDRAGKLVHVACQWAEQLRGPFNDGSGKPTLSIESNCPGFSAGTYTDAESWGLYLTK